jgi:GxxExxY protein
VHKELGPGYLESVYEAALCTELEFREIAYVNQYPISVLYKGRFVGESRIDLLVEKCLAHLTQSELN